jgi:hypothetical protein
MAPSTLASLRSLYGVRVPAEHFAALKTITDLLIGQSDTREYITDARQRCAEIALRAWNESKTPPRSAPPAVASRRRWRAVRADRSLPVNVIVFPARHEHRSEVAA